MKDESEPSDSSFRLHPSSFRRPSPPAPLPQSRERGERDIRRRRNYNSRKPFPGASPNDHRSPARQRPLAAQPRRRHRPRLQPLDRQRHRPRAAVRPRRRGRRRASRSRRPARVGRDAGRRTRPRPVPLPRQTRTTFRGAGEARHPRTRQDVAGGPGVGTARRRDGRVRLRHSQPAHGPVRCRTSRPTSIAKRSAIRSASVPASRRSTSRPWCRCGCSRSRLPAATHSS